MYNRKNIIEANDTAKGACLASYYLVKVKVNLFSDQFNLNNRDFSSKAVGIAQRPSTETDIGIKLFASCCININIYHMYQH